MKRVNRIVLTAAAGLLLTAGAVGAGGMTEKVKGILHNGISVTVNGSETGIHPVMIDGKAYLPARDTAHALGIGLDWNGRVLELNSREAEEAEQYMTISGVIASAAQEENRTRLEVLGHGPNRWIILYADKETRITDGNGGSVQAKDLKPGMAITAEYGPMMALRFPATSHAASIQIDSQRLIKEAPIFDVRRSDDGWQIRFSEQVDGKETETLVLTAGKETLVVTPQGEPVDWSLLKAGTKVRAYYGPALSKSMPPQGPLHVLVVLDESIGRLDPATVAEYRSLAWTMVPKEDRPHLITKKDEAGVSLVKAKGAAIVPVDDKMKQVLADIQAKDGEVVAVEYRTDQDALLGPLTIVIHPETKALIGYFMRY